MGLRMIFALILPEPSKAASISCLLASGVRTRPRLSCLRISPADTIDAVDVIASRLRHLLYLRQGVLGATLTALRANLRLLYLAPAPALDSGNPQKSTAAAPHPSQDKAAADFLFTSPRW